MKVYTEHVLRRMFNNAQITLAIPNKATREAMIVQALDRLPGKITTIDDIDVDKLTPVMMKASGYDGVNGTTVSVVQLIARGLLEKEIANCKQIVANSKRHKATKQQQQPRHRDDDDRQQRSAGMPHAKRRKM